MLRYLYEPILDYKYNKNDSNIIRLDFTSECRNAILKDYLNKGFAIYEVDEKQIDSEILLKEIARFLNLKELHVPSIYINSNLYKNGVNQLSALEGTHRAFQTNNAQELHCDGTIEEIGLIRTSIIHCVKAAKQGGETIIFNSVGAFHNLYKEKKNRNILDILFKEDALKRWAINVDKQEYIGPVFKVVDNKLVSRFSKDNTSCWSESFVKDERVESAYNLINSLAVEDSPYFIDFKLKDKQGIILANDRIAHGRTAFCGDERRLVRGLYKGIIG